MYIKIQHIKNAITYIKMLQQEFRNIDTLNILNTFCTQSSSNKLEMCKCVKILLMLLPIY